MSNVDKKSSDLKTEREELDEILRSSVPGLVTKSSQRSAEDASQSKQGNSGTGHKLLIEPSVFNMGLLLPPALSFIQRLKDIVPKESDIVMSTLTSFLDDFLINVFQPQLDEAVTELCALTFIAPDAFSEDPNWAAVSPKPIFKVRLLDWDFVCVNFNVRVDREPLTLCGLSKHSVKCSTASRMIKCSPRWCSARL